MHLCGYLKHREPFCLQMHKYLLSEVAFKDKQKDEQFLKRKHTRSKYDQVTHFLVLSDRNMIITLHFALCMKIFQIINKLFPFTGCSLSINTIISHQTLMLKIQNQREAGVIYQQGQVIVKYMTLPDNFKNKLVFEKVKP